LILSGDRQRATGDAHSGLGRREKRHKMLKGQSSTPSVAQDDGSHETAFDHQWYRSAQKHLLIYDGGRTPPPLLLLPSLTKDPIQTPGNTVALHRTISLSLLLALTKNASPACHGLDVLLATQATLAIPMAHSHCIALVAHSPAALGHFRAMAAQWRTVPFANRLSWLGRTYIAVLAACRNRVFLFFAHRSVDQGISILRHKDETSPTGINRSVSGVTSLLLSADQDAACEVRANGAPTRPMAFPSPSTSHRASAFAGQCLCADARRAAAADRTGESLTALSPPDFWRILGCTDVRSMRCRAWQSVDVLITPRCCSRWRHRRQSCTGRVACDLGRAPSASAAFTDSPPGTGAVYFLALLVFLLCFSPCVEIRCLTGSMRRT